MSPLSSEKVLVQMPDFSEGTGEIVKPITSVGPFHKTVSHQLAHSGLSFVESQVPNLGDRRPLKGIREDRQRQPQPLVLFVK